MIQSQYFSKAKALADEEAGFGGLVSLEEISLYRQRIPTNTWAILFFIGYLIIGLLFYCYVDDISALDSIYLSIITMTTIGYGEASSI
eukprot:scaffold90_cov163-Ochromonas_danica.AAC.24